MCWGVVFLKFLICIVKLSGRAAGVAFFCGVQQGSALQWNDGYETWGGAEIF